MALEMHQNGPIKLALMDCGLRVSPTKTVQVTGQQLRELARTAAVYAVQEERKRVGRKLERCISDLRALEGIANRLQRGER